MGKPFISRKNVQITWKNGVIFARLLVKLFNNTRHLHISRYRLMKQEFKDGDKYEENKKS